MFGINNDSFSRSGNYPFHIRFGKADANEASKSPELNPLKTMAERQNRVKIQTSKVL
jgi:hypothetical protein